ncbi:MAG: NTP transferase domain-containing protein [Thermoanaerobaculia bacterium]
MREERQFAALPPLVGGILIGGASRRMGRPKALLEWQGESFLERIAGSLAAVVPEVFLLGSGIVLPAGVAGLPVVADVAGVGGPLAGLLSAAAARPDAAWLVLTCDQPLLTPAALAWLIGERRADRIAVLPRLTPGRLEPFPGIYEPGCRAALAGLAMAAAAGPAGGASLQPLGETAGVGVVPVPPALAAEFRGVNTLAEWTDLCRFAGRATKESGSDD